jgi:hypothetical protein
MALGFARSADAAQNTPACARFCTGIPRVKRSYRGFRKPTIAAQFCELSPQRTRALWCEESEGALRAKVQTDTKASGLSKFAGVYFAHDFGKSRKNGWSGLMGCFGSGRSGGGPVVEDALTLNLPRLFKTGWLKPGAWTSGTLCWSIVGTGEEIASMGFEAHLGEEEGYIQLHWTSTDRWSGEKRRCENRIALTTSPQPFGGRRWFFLCPRTGRRAIRLHLPSGVYTFACRAAYRLAYRSQRETPRDRSLSRAVQFSYL